jgi:hypothetical protein
MAEEKIIPEIDKFGGLSGDDVSALNYVLQHVKGSSPISTLSPLVADEAEL